MLVRSSILTRLLTSSVSHQLLLLDTVPFSKKEQRGWERKVLQSELVPLFAKAEFI